MWDGNSACIPICGRAFAVARYRVDVVKPRCTLPSQHPFPRTRGPPSICLLPNLTCVHTAPHVEVHRGRCCHTLSLDKAPPRFVLMQRLPTARAGQPVALQCTAQQRKRLGSGADGHPSRRLVLEPISRQLRTHRNTACMCCVRRYHAAKPSLTPAPCYLGYRA